MTSYPPLTLSTPSDFTPSVLQEIIKLLDTLRHSMAIHAKPYTLLNDVKQTPQTPWLGLFASYQSHVVSFGRYCKHCVLKPLLQKGLGVFLWGILSSTLSAEAVSLIVGMPSADTTPKKQLLLTHESQLSPWKTGLGSDWKRRPDWNSFQFLTYGTSDRTELSFAASNIASKPEETLHIAGGYKSYIPILEKKFPKHQFRLIHGAMLPVSLRGQGLGYWAFTMGSVTLPRTKTRFTAGVSAGSQEVYGRDVVVAMVGVEQKLGKHWAIAMDWQSGRHDLGAFIPAVLYHFNSSDVLILGYKLPNHATNGKQAIVIEFTKRLK
jgi:hypothetical protein